MASTFFQIGTTDNGTVTAWFKGQVIAEKSKIFGEWMVVADDIDECEDTTIVKVLNRIEDFIGDFPFKL